MNEARSRSLLIPGQKENRVTINMEDKSKEGLEKLEKAITILQGAWTLEEPFYSSTEMVGDMMKVKIYHKDKTGRVKLIVSLVGCRGSMGKTMIESLVWSHNKAYQIGYHNASIEFMNK